MKANESRVVSTVGELKKLIEDVPDEVNIGTLDHADKWCFLRLTRPYYDQIFFSVEKVY